MEKDNKIYAVIDTNVIVSALISKQPGAAPLTVLANVFSGDITPVFNDAIIEECREVLSREKFHLKPQDIDTVLSVIASYGLNLERTPADDESFPDPKDIIFYEVKMSKDDAYLVTGNKKHFPRKPFVVTPREMVYILAKQEPEINIG